MLEVICGPMYSGKSEELMRRLRRAQVAGKRVRAFKPAIDDRFGIEVIKSHAGSEFECVSVSESGRDILEMHKGFDVIGIDEAQFFDYQLQEVVNILLNRQKHVILAGLDMTYRQEPWAGFPYFMAVADKLDKITAVCHKCGSENGIFTQRLIDGKPAPFEGPTVLVGAQDSYEARCRTCFERA